MSTREGRTAEERVHFTPHVADFRLEGAEPGVYRPEGPTEPHADHEGTAPDPVLKELRNRRVHSLVVQGEPEGIERPHANTDTPQEKAAGGIRSHEKLIETQGVQHRRGRKLAP